MARGAGAWQPVEMPDEPACAVCASAYDLVRMPSEDGEILLCAAHRERRAGERRRRERREFPPRPEGRRRGLDRRAG